VITFPTLEKIYAELRKYKLNPAISESYSFPYLELKFYIKENGKKKEVKVPEELLPLRRDVQKYLVKLMEKGVISGYIARIL
jgi:hypothetical protein